MLRPITNWKDLTAFLAKLKVRPYYCEDCEHVWLGPAAEQPVRCPRRDCRAWAKAPRYESAGRPPTLETK